MTTAIAGMTMSIVPIMEHAQLIYHCTLITHALISKTSKMTLIVIKHSNAFADIGCLTDQSHVTFLTVSVDMTTNSVRTMFAWLITLYMIISHVQNTTGTAVTNNYTLNAETKAKC